MPADLSTLWQRQWPLATPVADTLKHIHLYASCVQWRPGLIGDLLRAVADDAVRGVMITSPSFDRTHHPYDGGADVLLRTGGERDVVKQRHTDWLSAHPSRL